MRWGLNRVQGLGFRMHLPVDFGMIWLRFRRGDTQVILVFLAFPADSAGLVA